MLVLTKTDDNSLICLINKRQAYRSCTGVKIIRYIVLFNGERLVDSFIVFFLIKSSNSIILFFSFYNKNWITIKEMRIKYIMRKMSGLFFILHFMR